MLTGKQKRYLRALAATIEPIVIVGKGGINANLLQQVDEALEARELIKVKVLRNCMEELADVAQGLSAGAAAEIAQTIGGIIVLYRPSKKHPQIILP